VDRLIEEKYKPVVLLAKWLTMPEDDDRMTMSVLKKIEGETFDNIFCQGMPLDCDLSWKDKFERYFKPSSSSNENRIMESENIQTETNVTPDILYGVNPDPFTFQNTTTSSSNGHTSVFQMNQYRYSIVLNQQASMVINQILI